MDRIRQIVEYTLGYLNKLTPTHKMLMGSAAIIMLMTLFITAQYAGRSQMVPLGVEGTSVGDVVMYLRGNNISYETASNDLLVPAEDHMRIVQALTQNGTLGADAIENLMESIQNQAWWQPREQNQQALNAAMSKVLSDIISGWSYVQRATVIVQSPLRRVSLGKPQPRPTASVEVQAKSNATLTQDQVRAVADFVAGAVPDLLPTDVKIIDAGNGRSMRVRDNGDFSSSTYAELRNKIENDYEQKLYDLLRYIPGVIIAVNAQLDNAPETTVERDYKKEGTGTVVPLVSETSNNMEDTTGTRGADAGVRSNTGTSVLNRSASASMGRNSNESQATFDPKVGSTEKSVHDPKGYATMVRAAISVPRSFYERIWEQQNPDSTDPPDDAALASIMTDENQKVTDLISQVIDTSALNPDETDALDASGNNRISVHMYYDFGESAISSQGNGSVMEADSGGGLSLLKMDGVNSSVKTIAVLLLALVSMFFMFRLIRGASARGQLPSAEELVGIPPTLETDDSDIIGTAASSDPAMDAIELDDEELRTRGLSDQLEDLVNANPQEAARLLTKWVSDD